MKQLCVRFNCFSIFRENRGSQGGTVALLYFPIHFEGTNTFISNVGPTIRVHKTSISV